MRGLIGISIIFIILMASCKKDDRGICLKSAGEITMEERTIEPFKYIVLRDRINIELVQDSLEYAVVESGKNLIPGLITEVVGDSLLIYEVNKCNWTRRFDTPKRIELHVRDLEWIVQRGAGKVTSLNPIQGSRFGFEVWNASGDADIHLNVDTCYALVHTGPSDINYSGTAQVGNFYSASTGFIDMTSLSCTEANVNNSGISDITVNAVNSLIVQIQLSGNVYYYGSPVVNDFIDGTGELIHLP